MIDLQRDYVKERIMDHKTYHDATVEMEKAGVDPEYIEGWQSGFIGQPMREEQRVTEAYEAGYNAGKEQDTGGYSSWAKK
jgi:hypothetical protein